MWFQSETTSSEPSLSPNLNIIANIQTNLMTAVPKAGSPRPLKFTAREKLIADPTLSTKTFPNNPGGSSSIKLPNRLLGGKRLLANPPTPFSTESEPYQGLHEIFSWAPTKTPKNRRLRRQVSLFLVHNNFTILTVRTNLKIFKVFFYKAMINRCTKRTQKQRSSDGLRCFPNKENIAPSFLLIDFREPKPMIISGISPDFSEISISMCQGTHVI